MSVCMCVRVRARARCTRAWVLPHAARASYMLHVADAPAELFIMRRHVSRRMALKMYCTTANLLSSLRITLSSKHRNTVPANVSADVVKRRSIMSVPSLLRKKYGTASPRPSAQNKPISTRIHLCSHERTLRPAGTLSVMLARLQCAEPLFG